MRPFELTRARDLPDAIRLGTGTAQGQVDAATQYLAGGTTLIDLMKLDVLRPRTLIDLRDVRASSTGKVAAASSTGNVAAGPRSLRLSAFATMAVVAQDPEIERSYPVIADTLKLAASPQLRNMATLGGNVLQKTRCAFYRDTSWDACNKRSPGSGCQAISSFNRNHAILGTDSSCIAQYPGDFAIALVALEASVEVAGPRGERRFPFEALHVGPDARPDVETSLGEGEIITAFDVPAGPWTARSLYLKIRDRSSYEFALASCAVALALEGGIVRTARLGLGGMAYRPWRARSAERLLEGKPLTETTARQAAAEALAGATTHGHNDYKRELAQRVIVRALLQANAMSPAAART